MRTFLVTLVVVAFAGAAAAQTKPAPPVNLSGSAGVKTHLQALHYKDVQDHAVVVSFPLVEDPNTLLLAW